MSFLASRGSLHMILNSIFHMCLPRFGIWLCQNFTFTFTFQGSVQSETLWSEHVLSYKWKWKEKWIEFQKCSPWLTKSGPCYRQFVTEAICRISCWCRIQLVPWLIGLIIFPSTLRSKSNTWTCSRILYIGENYKWKLGNCIVFLLQETMGARRLGGDGGLERRGLECLRNFEGEWW